MNNQFKLNEKELEELRKLSLKSDAAKKAIELIGLVQSNPALNGYVALTVTHDKICSELMENDVKLFNTDPEFAKTFDGYLKWKDKLVSDVDAMNVLRNKLLPEEEIVANKKIKSSTQIYIQKPQLNGMKN